ncbi:hypothetical protein, partial [Alterinioella nitratireducens]|uniref:hypothetical protein n=1 Tax=Alterinioella nitratireducens TaxID=2735915 RepID=UPI001BE4A66D
FVSAAPGPRAAHDRDRDAQAVIYRTRGDGPWLAVCDDLTSMPYALTYCAGRLFAGLGDGRILASDDDGDRWQELDLAGDRLDRVQALVAV